MSDQSKRTTQYEWAKAMKADLLIIVRHSSTVASRNFVMRAADIGISGCVMVDQVSAKRFPLGVAADGTISITPIRTPFQTKLSRRLSALGPYFIRRRW